MITCLDLYESHRSASTSPEGLKAQDKKYDALILSHSIWTSRKGFSRDARRASNVLVVMLSKIPRPNISSTLVNTPQEMSSASQVLMNDGNMMVTAESPSGSLLRNTVEFDNPGQEFSVGNDALPDLDPADPLKTMFSESEDIDWVSLDGPDVLGTND